MREKELRIALVFFGGISLAVYMNGISKEILKLVRASASLHAIRDRSARHTSKFLDGKRDDDDEFDTESIYYELLREIGHRVELRAIVDVISGASAGGVNGTMLARALAHDLPIGALRDLWLTEGDVTRLLAPEAMPRAWSKFFLLPFIWGVARTQFFEEIRDPEVRRKISLFVRARWFKPPFSGRRMSELMYDAAISMGAESDLTKSLLPIGHPLDLFVPVTDYYGYQQFVESHDPPLIAEREHSHTLHFSYARFSNGEVETDFGLDDAPSLAFAARATSAFPGAFPPAQMSEIEHMLSRRGLKWTSIERFLARNFDVYARGGLNPRTTSFIDGAVLNNKPFGAALQAIRGRAAFRQIDRRLVYIDPDPRQEQLQTAESAPGFFATLKGALSDIPRNEPLANELRDLASFNARVRQRKAIADAARPRILELVSHVLSGSENGHALVGAQTTAQMRAWRESVNAQVVLDAGFAYESYVRLKLTLVRESLAALIAALIGLPPHAPALRRIGEIVDCWATGSGTVYKPPEAAAAERAETGEALPRWVRFLLAFDVDFRKRRLFFLIQGQNRIYQLLDEGKIDRPSESVEQAALIDRLKRDFYQILDVLRRREKPDFFSGTTRAAARQLFAGIAASQSLGAPPDEAQNFAAAHAKEISGLVERLASEIDLRGSTDQLDALLSRMDPATWSATARREVLTNYLGFPYWDVLTLPVTNWRDAGEFDEIRVDRISADDAKMVRELVPGAAVKGIGFAHFAAFFSRAYRENDYLLGRLHAIDRLIDIVCDSAGAEAVARVDIPDLKRRAFARIVKAEAPHLQSCGALIDALNSALAQAEDARRTTAREKVPVPERVA